MLGIGEAELLVTKYGGDRFVFSFVLRNSNRHLVDGTIPIVLGIVRNCRLAFLPCPAAYDTFGFFRPQRKDNRPIRTLIAQRDKSQSAVRG